MTEFLVGKILSWKALQRAVEHKLVSTLYIWLIFVPIAAQTLQHLPEQMTFVFFGSEPITLQTSLPFNWYIFYFSALFAYAAYLIYSIFCPQFLKLYQDAGVALQSGLTIQRLRRAQEEFLESYFSRSYTISETEQKCLTRIFRQMRAHSVEFEAMLPNPDGASLAKLLGDIVVSTDEGGQYYILPDGSHILRDQLFKHVFGDLIALQDISFFCARTITSILLCASFLGGFGVVSQGTYFVLKSML